MAVKKEKQLAIEWQKMTENIRKATPIDRKEKTEARDARIKRLEAPGNQEEWIKYYFPKYAFAAPAKFHIASTGRLVGSVRQMKLKGSGKFYQSRAWARGLSKTTRRMMEVFYITFAMKFETNMLLCSKSEGNAQLLLAPYRANLEANQRLIQDYGKQQNLGSWEAGKFITTSGHAFRAVGADQNPRGSKNEEMRVSIAGFDDIDDDEVCRNKDRVAERWTWIEKAVIPCVEISKPYIIFFDNNIIAEDSLAMRAREKANDKEIINIRDDAGRSTWPEKNTEEMIDEMLANISYESAQGEYFNNPMSQGRTFPEIHWGKCPPLEQIKIAVVYADPATSNTDKPGQKSNLLNSRKAVFIIGYHNDKYYIYTGFLDVMSQAKFISYFYQCRDYIAGKTNAYYVIENNTLQDPFYQQVILPHVFEYAKTNNVQPLSITPDARDKKDKWFRIEGNLEPVMRFGRLIFNEDEKGNPHMQRLAAQFLAAKPTSKELDGPDCIEGGKFIIDQKAAFAEPDSVRASGKSRNPKKY